MILRIIVILVVWNNILNRLIAKPHRPYTIPPYGNKSEVRIVRGFPCSADDFPFLVLVIGKSFTSGWMRLCGGTLISATWVLTAAHCFSLAGAEYAIMVPDHHGTKPMIVLTEKIFPHQHYDNESFARDIALMKLKTPLNKEKHIGYVQLPQFKGSDSEPPCVNGLIMGWGVTEVHMPEINDLQCAFIPLFNRQNCSEIYDYHGMEVTAEQLCTLSMERIDACSGDSGGPLLCGSVQVGIISWGIDCGEPEFPGVYTRIDAYLEFIAATMQTTKKSLAYQLNVSIYLFLIGLSVNNVFV